MNENVQTGAGNVNAARHGTMLYSLVRSAAARFMAAGIPRSEAQLDAEVLARDVLGWDRATWIARARDAAPPGFETRYAELTLRRAAREPMAYIRGRAEFWGLEFEVTPAVLIPRPETELIVEVALEIFASRGPDLIIDVGTGSGCVAIALAREFPRARLVATDISPDAIDVARRNARRHGLEGRIDFRRRDLASSCGHASLIVSNPPYVAHADRAALQPEVRDHEPAPALFAGGDGLDTIRRLLSAAHGALAPGGWLVFEFGFGQADTVKDLLACAGSTAAAAAVPHTAGEPRSWSDVSLRPDLGGIPRVAAARSTRPGA